MVPSPSDGQDHQQSWWHRWRELWQRGPSPSPEWTHVEIGGESGESLMERGLRALTAGIALLAPLGVALHVYSAHGFTHTVGVFVVLAELLREGILYPSVATPDLVYSAFYHPLAFAPLALLPGHGIDMLPGVRILVGSEACACIGLTVWLAHRQGLTGIYAWQPALWALCTVPVTFCLLGMRDDPRSVLLGLSAITAYLRCRRFGPELAGLLLALAFFTKATAPFAPGMALTFAAWQRGRTAAVARLWIVGAAATALGIAWLQWGLHVDFLGNGLYYAVFNPAKDPRTWAETLAAAWRDLTWDRTLPFVLGSSLLAGAIAAIRRRLGLFDVLVLAAAVKTIAAYRSVGTELNHLLDWTLFASLHLGLHLRPWLRPMFALPLLLGVLLLSWPQPFLTFFPQERPSIQHSHVAEKATVLRALSQDGKLPILCEEPLLAYQAGVKPLITDPLLTFGTLRRFPEIRETWFGPADQPGALQMLVLMRNPFADDAEAWYGPIHFDRRFLEDVRRDWQVGATDMFATVLQRKPK